MLRNMLSICLVPLIASMAFGAEIEEPANVHAKDRLAGQAATILKNYCHRCHAGENSESGYAFDVTSLSSLSAGGAVGETAEESDLYQAMFRGKMPPKNRPQLPRPTAEEVETIKQWIDSGKPGFPQVAERSPKRITHRDVLSAIHDDLSKANREDRNYRRYFSLSHLYNDTGVDDQHLSISRAALSKALNSLSWEAKIALPKAIDSSKTIYRIDLRDFGWTRDHWNALVAKYPYAIGFDAHDNLELGELDAKIEHMRGSLETYVLRADWFVAVATKPPLYHTLLYDLTLDSLKQRPNNTTNFANPKSMTTFDLENKLGIATIANIAAGKAQRAGFTESRVSGQNRLLEWHPISRDRYYWMSYDFKPNNRRSILSEFPLGPTYQGNEHASLAFEHDGSEVIFSLPNGMQGYLLADGKGNRIDAGPIDVVADSLKTSGNEQIVTGVSCIACHRQGIIRTPADEIRSYSRALSDALRRVEQLYPERERFEAMIERSRSAFMVANREATEPFLESSLSGNDGPEPIGEVARRFHLQPIGLKTLAAELGIEAESLAVTLESDRTLRATGLRVLLREGGSIKRAAWESPAEFPLMKQVARQFKFSPK